MFRWDRPLVNIRDQTFCRMPPDEEGSSSSDVVMRERRFSMDMDYSLLVYPLVVVSVQRMVSSSESCFSKDILKVSSF